MTTSWRPEGRSGFTLTELLMVMMVVTILYCISLSVIRTGDRAARKTAARAELNSIESAVKQYYAHYLAWPPCTATADEAAYQAADYSAPVGRFLAQVLSGATGRVGDAASANPDGLVFMEFSRQTKNDEPLNPWGASGRYDKGKCLYHLAMDTDGDNYVAFPSNGMDNCTAVSRLPSGRLYRGSVIVWTFNPELKTDNEDYLIGSWQ